MEGARGCIGRRHSLPRLVILAIQPWAILLFLSPPPPLSQDAHNQSSRHPYIDGRVDFQLGSWTGRTQKDLIFLKRLHGSFSTTWYTRWSGDVIRRTGEKNFNAVSHNRECYFRIQHGRGEVRSLRFPLECSFGNRKCGRHRMICWVLAMEILQGILKQGRARLWDTALKFFFPALQITSPDHLEEFIIQEGVIFTKNGLVPTSVRKGPIFKPSVAGK